MPQVQPAVPSLPRPPEPPRPSWAERLFGPAVALLVHLLFTWFLFYESSRAEPSEVLQEIPVQLVTLPPQPEQPPLVGNTSDGGVPTAKEEAETDSAQGETSEPPPGPPDAPPAEAEQTAEPTPQSEPEAAPEPAPEATAPPEPTEPEPAEPETAEVEPAEPEPAEEEATAEGTAGQGEVQMVQVPVREQVTETSPAPPPEKPEREVTLPQPEPPQQAQPRETTRAVPAQRSQQLAALGGSDGGGGISSQGYGKADSYLMAVFAWLEQRKTYPEAARARNMHGFSVFSFEILADGSIRNLELVRTSGFPLIDQAVRNVVRVAAPLPPPPQGYVKNGQGLRVFYTSGFLSE